MLLMKIKMKPIISDIVNVGVKLFNVKKFSFLLFRMLNLYFENLVQTEIN